MKSFAMVGQRLVCVGVMGLGVATGWGQVGSQGSGQADAARRTVRFQVENESGQPVEKATISATWLTSGSQEIPGSPGVSSAPEYTVPQPVQQLVKGVTDASGKGELQLTDGAGLFSVGADGYVQSLKPFEVVPTAPLRFQLSSKGGAAVRGKVVDSKTKAPVAGHKVSVVPIVMRSFDAGRGHQMTVSLMGVTETASTGADGTYVFPRLPEGRVSVSAENPAMGGNPASNRPGQAQADVKAGQETAVRDLVVSQRK